MKKYFRKKLYVTTGRTHFVTVKLFIRKQDMQEAYRDECPKDLQLAAYKTVLGAHHAFVSLKVNKNGRAVYNNETGTIFLSFENCGAGVVTHEIGHAVLWAWKHKKSKQQFPIVIKNMNDEEEILHNHTQATKDFYTWFWKIKQNRKLTLNKNNTQWKNHKK